MLSQISAQKSKNRSHCPGCTETGSRKPCKALETYPIRMTSAPSTPSPPLSQRTHRELQTHRRSPAPLLRRPPRLHPIQQDRRQLRPEQKVVERELEKKMLEEGLKVGEETIKIVKTEGKLLDEFNEKHRFHYNGIVDKLRKDFEVRLKEEKRNKKRAQMVEFDFGESTILISTNSRVFSRTSYHAQPTTAPSARSNTP
jgi:hypothetical protein